MELIKRQLILLFLLANYAVVGQSRSFQLSFTGGMNELDQYLYIQQEGKFRKITLVSFNRMTNNQISAASARISKKNCDTLWSLLDSYEFKHDFIGRRNWYDSVLCFSTELPDSLRVVLNGDTIRKELLSWFHYAYEPNTRNYYSLRLLSRHFGTDDTKQMTIKYRNEGILNNLKLELGMIITEQDRNLVSFLIDLVHKYRTHFNKEDVNILITEMTEEFN